MKRKFIIGPPGTGKTTRLVKIYYSLIQKYTIEKIQVISHTNVAADEIRAKILDEKEARRYEKKYNVVVWDKITIKNKKLFERTVSTIHRYCKNNLFNAQVFDEATYMELCRRKVMFQRYYNGPKDLKSLNKKHPFFRFLGFAKDNGFTLAEYWNSPRLTNEDRADYKYTLSQLEELNIYYQDFKKDIKLNGKSSYLKDFIDMIEHFYEAPKDPDLDVLIVDEAQDSSVPQRKALDKMEKKAQEVYWAGDPDQAIFAFAGADPDYFSRISINPDEELKQGHRCPKRINQYCKSIIEPIWKHYGYRRTWIPTNEEGEIYRLENLNQCPQLSLLLDRLKNTDESFIFTYRGGNGPRDTILAFFKRHGIRYGRYGTDIVFVKNWEISCHRNFPHWIGGKPLHLTEIKDFWKKGGSKLIAHGKGEFDFKGYVKRDYTVDEFIQDGLIKPEAKQYTKYEDIKLKEAGATQLETFKRTEYINQIIKDNVDLKKDLRIFYENIHSIKGTEFDNVILDESLPRWEDRFTRIRLRYVACSRAKKTLWLLRRTTERIL